MSTFSFLVVLQSVPSTNTCDVPDGFGRTLNPYWRYRWLVLWSLVKRVLRCSRRTLRLTKVVTIWETITTISGTRRYHGMEWWRLRSSSFFYLPKKEGTQRKKRGPRKNCFHGRRFFVWGSILSCVVFKYPSLWKLYFSPPRPLPPPLGSLILPDCGYFLLFLPSSWLILLGSWSLSKTFSEQVRLTLRDSFPTEILDWSSVDRLVGPFRIDSKVEGSYVSPYIFRFTKSSFTVYKRCSYKDV